MAAAFDSSVILLVIATLIPLGSCVIYYADECNMDPLEVMEFYPTTIKAWRDGPNGWGTARTCVVYFQAGYGNKVEVNFRKLDLPCNSDASIIFYDGPTTSSIQLTTVGCSDTLPDKFLSTGPSLTAEIVPGSISNYDFNFSVYKLPPGPCDDGNCEGDGKLEVTTILKIVGAVAGLLVLIAIMVFFIVRVVKKRREERRNFQSRLEREREFLETYKAEHPGEEL